MRNKEILWQYIQMVLIALNTQEEYEYAVWPEDLMDEDFLKEFSVFYNANRQRYLHLFNLVADYFDSLDHRFESTKGKSLFDYKLELLEYLDYFQTREKLEGITAT